MDMSKVKVGSKVVLRDGREVEFLGEVVREKGVRKIYKIGSGHVWYNGRTHENSKNDGDVVGVVGVESKGESKGEGDEYLEKLNELSTENIILGRVIEKVLGKVSNETCGNVLGERCTWCMLMNGEDEEERKKCLRSKLEWMVLLEMREETSCG